MRVSLKWKFIAFLAVLLIFVIGILSFLILKGISTYQRQQLEHAMQQQAEVASDRIRQQYVTGTQVDPATFMRLQGPNLARELGTVSGMRVRLYDAKGTEVGDSLPMVEKPDVHQALSYASQNKIAYTEKGDLLEYLFPISGSDGQMGIVHFQSSVREQHAFYRNMLQLCLIAGISVLGISFLFGLVYMNRQANAIHRLKSATDRIRQGDYLEKPSLRRKDELGELSQGVFEMNRAIQLNMTSLQEEQAKLLQALDQLRQLEQQQKQFIHNISHEFKTPLTSIRAYTDLLHMYADDPDLIQEAREAISKETGRLYELVERVLHLAALENYAFDYRPESVEVKDLLEDLCHRMKGKAEQFGITLHHELVPGRIWADRNNVAHIFLNLIDNAIKYNIDHGEVFISNCVAADQMEVKIRDTGVGIPEERRERIFEPFYTINQDRARQSGGSGLGLALVKQLTLQQHGSIRVEEAAGAKGTVFVLTFPLEKS